MCVFLFFQISTFRADSRYVYLEDWKDVANERVDVREEPTDNNAVTMNNRA